MSIIVNNATASAMLLLSDKVATIEGEASHGKRVAAFSFSGVSPDPRKGDDALAIVILIASLQDDRADAIAEAVSGYGEPVKLDDLMESGAEYADAKQAVSDYRTAIAKVRADAGKAFDETDAGGALTGLSERFASSKRATFRVPGTETYATLSAVLGKVTGGRVAGAFAKARNAKA